MATFIDLNSDLGEHPNADLDEQIMPFISSCNIACGGHAGDEDSVFKTINLAAKHGVAIGAHPSFPDRDNFGREVLNMDLDDLKNSLKDQIGLVQKACNQVGTKLHHVKPHGALYNLAAKDESVSTMICETLLELDDDLLLYGLAHSITEKIANDMNVSFAGEAFADRKYEMDKSLRSRKLSGAVLTDENEVLSQVEELVLNSRAKSEEWITVSAKTICLHSDTKGSVHLAQSIRKQLEQKEVHIRPV